MALGASASKELSIAIFKPASRFVSCNASTVCCKLFVAADNDCASEFKLLICFSCSPIVWRNRLSCAKNKTHNIARPVASDQRQPK